MNDNDNETVYEYSNNNNNNNETTYIKLANLPFESNQIRRQKNEEERLKIQRRNQENSQLVKEVIPLLDAYKVARG